MSLKSKIEAVIYASEEPVTLVQLVGLLSEEAQAELDAIAAKQAQLGLDGAPALTNSPASVQESYAPDSPDQRGEPVAAEAGGAKAATPEAVPPAAASEAPAEDAASDDEALNAEVLASEATEEVDETDAPAADVEADEAEDAEATEAAEAASDIAATDPAGDADATEDPAEEAVVDELVAEEESGSEGAESGDEAAPDETPEAKPEANPEAELDAELDAEVAAASHSASGPKMEYRQPTPAEDEASARAEARAKERELRNYLRSLVDELIREYANADRGIEIREVAGGFRFSTKPEYHDAVRGFIKSLKPPMKLSLQALETLAVIAYKQPITAPEISEIRGVDSGGVVGSLIARKLVTTAGRKQVIGRPILYKTTKDFLVRFGLKDINELPSIEEFEKMAGELADLEPTQEEIPMDVVEEAAAEDMAALREAAEEAEPMADEHEAQADGVPDAELDSESEELGSIVEAPDVDADMKPEEHSEEPVEGADEPEDDATPVDADDQPEVHGEAPLEDAEESGEEEPGIDA